MEYLLDFVALVLAIDATMSAWFYGSIFESTRSSIEKRGGLIGELAGCLFCLSYHASFWITVLLWAPAQLLAHLSPCLAPYALIPRIPLYALAAADLVHWLQGEHPVPEDDQTRTS